MQRPLLITGATGTLGRAFAQVCDLRGLDHRLTSRAELDIAETASVESELVRPSKLVLKWPRARSAWTSMKCAPGPAGTATSRWRCWRMPISPRSAAPRVGKKGVADLKADLLPLTVPEVGPCV